jgi:hypothetical protein
MIDVVEHEVCDVAVVRTTPCGKELQVCEESVGKGCKRSAHAPGVAKRLIPRALRQRRNAARRRADQLEQRPRLLPNDVPLERTVLTIDGFPRTR